MTQDLSFIHHFEPGTSTAAPLLLLHGTGGDETDLLPLGKALAPARALLSPRGKVLENGMPRFFRRLAEGVFDEQDVVKRANELADFIVEAGKAYGLAKPVAVGFSNGANIAAAILLLRPEALSGAILLRAMVPLAKPPQAKLDQTPVLIVSGASDPIIPASNASLLATMLKNAQADVQHVTLPTGHNLTQNDVTIATKWLNR
ncbi:MAG: alpha/beta hydrolase [Hyphomicrobiales bacterium]|nr:alpha/beta hydrolase [Hyphomicrobiales bacterium]